MSGEVAEGLTTRGRPLPDKEAAGLPTGWVATIAALSVISVAVTLLYWSEAAGAVRVWYASEAYTHGFLILPIVAYLIWERRPLLSGVSPKPVPWVLLLVPAIGAVWLVARLIGLLEAQQFLLLAMLQVVLLSVLGWRVYRLLAFPLLYLFFLVPSGEFLVPYLQDFTARFTVLCLQLSGIPVYSDGFLISIPNENFYVAEACAGLRFLIATIAFGFLFADFAYRSMWRKVCFVALCLVAPVIANGFRAYGIILLAYFSGGTIAVEADHIIYGWVFFSMVTVGLMAVGWTFRQSPAPYRAGSGASATPVRAGHVVMVACIALVTIALPRSYAAFLDAPTSHPAGSHLTLPAVGAAWTADGTDDSWHPRYATADFKLQQGFRDGDRRVDLFVAYYTDQNQEKKLLAFGNKIAGGDEWEIADRSRATVTVGGAPVPVAADLYNWAGRKRLIYYAYWVDGQFETNPLKVKLLQAKAALTGGSRAAAIVAFATEVTLDNRTAAATLADFAAQLQALRPTLSTMATP
jgi:exosortase A